MGQIVVELAWLAASVYLVLATMRVVAQLSASRLPALSHGIEFAIGK